MVNSIIGFLLSIALIYAHIKLDGRFLVQDYCDQLKYMMSVSQTDNRYHYDYIDVVDLTVYDGTYHQVKVRSLELLLGQTYMVEQNSV